MPLQAHVCAAKSGINHLVRVLAMEWGPDVRVNAIFPGPVAGTQGTSRLACDETTHDAYFARIPMRRWAETGEVAEAAVFLSSASAAYITGAIIDVDGGSQLGDASRNSLDKGLA
jgi:NAD(P)-dependent dehydrogenase (short-subunit alcohol dehydrogenase family)